MKKTEDAIRRPVESFVTHDLPFDISEYAVSFLKDWLPEVMRLDMLHKKTRERSFINVV